MILIGNFHEKLLFIRYMDINLPVKTSAAAH